VKRCGKILPGTAGVTLVKTESGAGFRGLRRCGSFWVCADCAKQITAQRFEQTRQVLDGVASDGHSLEFVTLTLAHYKRDKLADLLATLQDAWKLLRRRNVADLRGMKYVRSLEIRWSFSQGWHAHFHAVIWGAARGSLKDWLEAEWVSAVRACGGRAGVTGQLVKSVDHIAGVAQYLTKEMVTGEMKDGESLHPFELLRLAANGDRRMQAVWREYETTLKANKTRWLVFSKGLLPAYVDLDVPVEDETEVGVIPADSFHQLAEVEKAQVLEIVKIAATAPEASDNVAIYLEFLGLQFCYPGQMPERVHQLEDEGLIKPPPVWNRRGGYDKFIELNCEENPWELHVREIRETVESRICADIEERKMKRGGSRV
jgi:hypothetical protein